MSRRAGLVAILALACAACTGVNGPSASSPAPSGVTVASAPAGVASPAGPASAPTALAPSASPSPDQTAGPTPAPTNKPRKSHAPKPTSSAAATATPTPTATDTPTPTPTDAPKPDLIIKSFSVPATVTHDVTATGAMYVQNLGPGDVGPFTVDLYGSCAQEALSLAPVDVPGLAAGADKFIHISFSFSSVGACKVGATIDADSQVDESNENNNEISVDVTSQ